MVHGLLDCSKKQIVWLFGRCLWFNRVRVADSHCGPYICEKALGIQSLGLLLLQLE